MLVNLEIKEEGSIEGALPPWRSPLADLLALLVAFGPEEWVPVLILSGKPMLSPFFIKRVLAKEAILGIESILFKVFYPYIFSLNKGFNDFTGLALDVGVNIVQDPAVECLGTSSDRVNTSASLEGSLG
jgi:hypothetical protein